MRRPVDRDLPSLLALNNEHAVELSELNLAELRHLLDAAFHARVSVDASALLIAFDQAADYSSPNFVWFRSRYPTFVYVDRVVVSAAARGRGVARALYADLMSAARDAGHSVVCAEVNVDPPNPASDAFHAAFGFAEVGRAELPGTGKTVRYLARDL